MKGRELLVITIVGMFVMANSMLFGKANEVSIKRTKPNIDWVFIVRDWNGDAFIHLEFLLGDKEKVEQPMKISVVSFHSGEKKIVEFRDIHMKIVQSFIEKEDGKEIKNSIAQVRVHNFPGCKRAWVTLHYPEGNITRWGEVFQLKKPTKDEMIEIGSPKWNELVKNGNVNIKTNINTDTLGSVPGRWWVYFFPPFPERDSFHSPDWCGRDHYDSDTGDVGIACWSNIVQGGYIPHDNGTAVLMWAPDLG